MCRIANLFLLQRLKECMSGDARDFNNIETRVVIRVFFFFLQGKASTEIHAIRGTCTIVCHRQKLGGPVVIFPPVMRLVLDDPKQ